MGQILNIDRLSVNLGSLAAIDNVTLPIGAGETVCLVGESGSGKTVTAFTVMRLIDAKGGTVTQGAVHFEGRNLATLSQREMSDLRGRRIGIVFQEPMTALDPLFTIGEQIAEVLRRHRGLRGVAARAESVRLLRRVHIPDAELRAGQHPHHLSGGMRQRAMIAMALACEPRLLIADEPTTALDVTIQAQILALLRELQAQSGMAILLITHDFGIAAEMADRVVVMYAGRVVEDARAADLFAHPAHPYTRGLLQSIIGVARPRGEALNSIRGSIPGLAHMPAGCRFHPRCDDATTRCAHASPELRPRGAGHVACWHPNESALPSPQAAHPIAAAPTIAPSTTKPLLEAIDLHRTYRVGGGWFGGGSTVRAVDGVSLQIRAGESFGLVGESGCGKSTLGRLLLRLEKPTSGQVIFEGQDLSTLDAATLRRARRHMQMVFQDPYGSIDPRWTLGQIIGEPLRVHERLTPDVRAARVAALLADVGLEPAWQNRYPHQLSGGQRQRVAIARAIALRPRFILADEAFSALDASVQAQMVNLLQDLKDRLGLTYLFIGHGLHVVRHVSDRVGVMYLGRLVETGPVEAIFTRPAHPYTQALIAAIPRPGPGQRTAAATLEGDIPSAARLPSGCSFHTRCPAAQARCKTEAPGLTDIEPQRAVACHFPQT